jgi:hypothetical protein
MMLHPVKFLRTSWERDDHSGMKFKIHKEGESEDDAFSEHNLSF